MPGKKLQLPSIRNICVHLHRPMQALSHTSHRRSPYRTNAEARPRIGLVSYVFFDRLHWMMWIHILNHTLIKTMSHTLAYGSVVRKSGAQIEQPTRVFFLLPCTGLPTLRLCVYCWRLCFSFSPHTHTHKIMMMPANQCPVVLFLYEQTYPSAFRIQQRLSAFVFVCVCVCVKMGRQLKLERIFSHHLDSVKLICFSFVCASFSLLPFSFCSADDGGGDGGDGGIVVIAFFSFSFFLLLRAFIYSRNRYRCRVLPFV